MSGRQAFLSSLGHHSRRTAGRSQTVRRGTVVGVNPITVQMHHFTPLIQSDNDFFLSAWAKLYDSLVGIAKDDLVLMQQEGSDWMLFDVVTDADVVTRVKKALV